MTELTPGQAASYGAELVLARLIPARLGADLGWGLRREIDEVMRRYPNRADIHDYFGSYLGPRDEAGMATVEQLLGLSRRRDPDFQLPTKPRNVPSGRVMLDLEPHVVNDIVRADPSTLNATQRLLQDDYRRHLTAPDGSPLPAEELNAKLAELRQEGASWIKSGTTPPNAKYAGQTVFMKDPILKRAVPRRRLHQPARLPGLPPVCCTTACRDADDGSAKDGLRHLEQTVQERSVVGWQAGYPGGLCLASRRRWQ